MAKYFLQIGGIILGNLFAFLMLGHILDLIFGGNGSYKMIMILFSIPFLIIIMTLYIQKTLKQLKDISADGKPETGNT